MAYIDVDRAPRAPRPPAVVAGGSTGTWRSECGRNEQRIYNSDNVVASPGVVGGAHHTHDYVGNVSVNAFSTDQSLAEADTTCRDGDRSTYYWPVLRVPGHSGGEADGGHGTILVPDSVVLEYRGNAVSNVVAMPRFLRASTGNSRGFTRGGLNTERVHWTCSGTRNRVSRLYPRCPPGQRTVRVFDFPSCWNGRATDSPTHRTHVVFPDAAGACPVGTYPVPQLHVEVGYLVPSGVDYLIDSFPQERHSPITDHSDFISVMPEHLMAETVGCINTGRRC